MVLRLDAELRRRVEDLEAEWKRGQADVQRLRARLEVVTVAREDVLRAIAELSGAGRAKPESWREQLETVRKEAASTEEALRLAQKHVEVTQQRLVESRVRFKRLSKDEIERYLASGEWRGKAGGYAIQGLAGTFVVKLIGSYTSVVGLPLYETIAMLDGEGYPVRFTWLDAA